VIIRRATAADAEQGATVLRRSIVELCHADHGGDPAAIAAWTANKTPHDWRAWLQRDDIALIVAVEDDRVLGVGLVSDRGEIRLNYVSPDARLRGVSKALLTHMERWARDRGVERMTLESSRTGERFYLASGYQRDAGEVLRMSKPFGDHPAT
jgi:GNAT superfamily N-acetyltransferase